MAGSFPCNHVRGVVRFGPHAYIDCIAAGLRPPSSLGWKILPHLVHDTQSDLTFSGRPTDSVLPLVPPLSSLPPVTEPGVALPPPLSLGDTTMRLAANWRNELLRARERVMNEAAQMGHIRAQQLHAALRLI